MTAKKERPVYLTMQEAIVHCQAGASIWKQYCTNDGIDPHVVLVGCGNEMTTEVIEAARILKRDLPLLRVRVVNVTDLLVLDIEQLHPHSLNKDLFIALFTADRPVIFNFHGYPSAVASLLFGRDDHMWRTGESRFSIKGFLEQGTTTTPLDMLVLNRCSRYHIAQDAVRLASRLDSRIAVDCTQWTSYYSLQLKKFNQYIEEHGDDPQDFSNMTWE